MDYATASEACKAGARVIITAGPHKGASGPAVRTLVLFGEDHIEVETEAGKRNAPISNVAEA